MVALLIPLMFAVPVAALVAWHRPMWYSVLWSFFKWRAVYAIDRIKFRFRPETYKFVQDCSHWIVFPASSVPRRGFIVLIHGLGSSWWQWRNVVNLMREHPSFQGYAFYVPNVPNRGNINSHYAAREIADQISHFVNLFAAEERQEMDLIMVDSSMGSRIGMIVETMFAYECTGIPLVNIRRFIHVSIGAFLGPIPLATWAWACCGLIWTTPLEPSLQTAAVEEHPHELVLTTWRQLSVRRWKKDQAHYHFIASEHDELIPMSSSVPPSADNRNAQITVTTVPGHCHAGVAQAMAPMYIQWIADKIDEQDRE